MSFLLLTAWGATVLFGIEAIIEKLASRHIFSNPWLFNYFLRMFGAVGIIALSIFFGAGMPHHWSYIILAGIFSTLGGILYLFALYRLDVSVFIPLFSFKTVFAVILGTVFLGEILITKQYMLIGVIFIFGFFVSVDENFHWKSFFNKNVLIALIDTLCLAIMALFVKLSIAETGYWDTALWMTVVEVILLQFTVPLFKKEFKTVKRGHYGIIGLVAVIDLGAVLLANAAYGISISIATAIIAVPVSMIFAFIFSRYAPELLEKHTLKVYLVRFISAAVMIIAALNL